MSRLTSERVNGIKTGYWSPAKKDELIQRLGPIEELGPYLIRRFCDGLCRHRDEMPEPALASVCEGCPAARLEALIDGRDER